MENRHPLPAGRLRRRGAAGWTIGCAAVAAASILGITIRAGEPQDPATDAFYKVCSDCHDSDRIQQTRRTRGGWEDIIYQMIDKGAVGTNQDFTLVLQYLLSHRGMVNVNEATKEEIALVLDLSAAEVDAIMKYREDSGTFKNFDELEKLPGIDPAKLEAHRAAILF